LPTVRPLALFFTLTGEVPGGNAENSKISLKEKKYRDILFYAVKTRLILRRELRSRALRRGSSLQMGTQISNSFINFNIGAVYTPQKWAIFAIERYDLLGAWLKGETIFDPTMGEGNLLAAIIEYAVKKGHLLSELPISNLFGLELSKTSYEKALDVFNKSYNIDMSDNFFNDDILLFGKTSFEIIFGNPPWSNCVD
jgi:hypothetical protein